MFPIIHGHTTGTRRPCVVLIPLVVASLTKVFSQYMLQYDNATAEAVMLNGMRSLTLNGSVPTWPGCLACALSDRAFNYTSLNRSSECQSCFDTWCWNGSDNTTMPVEYEPVLGIAPSFLNITGGSSMTTATTNATTSVAPSKGAAGSVRVKLAGAWWSGMGLAVCMGLGVMMIFI